MATPRHKPGQNQPAAPDPDLQPLWQQGYALWPRDPLEAGVAVLRKAVLALAEAARPPVLYASPNVVLGPHALVTSIGLVLLNLLQERPDLAPLLLPPALVRAITQQLGPGAKVEVCGAVVSDQTRPFFPWHTHIDGVDEGERARSGHWPAVDKRRRILTLLYLDDVEEDGGPLLVLPRHLGDPTGPVAPLRQTQWPGQLVLLPKAGTLVALDECTWHAVLPIQRQGQRVFVAVYFVAADTVPAPSAELPLRPVEL
jgi:hypothetical protein